MAEYRKQHILPKTYLKYFSKNDSGKGIITLDISSHKSKAEYRNQGDSIFWSKNYYKDNRLKDSLAIEKYFGKNIEPTYNNLIKAIRFEKEIYDWTIKTRLLQWIIYSKLRSPIYRKDFEIKLNFKNKLEAILPNSFSILTDKILLNIDKYSKEFHLNHFIDKSLFEKSVEKMISGLVTKKWKVLVSPIDSFFWTSDNPGFSIDLDSYENTKVMIPSKYLENFSSGSVHYYPLTKDYCLEFGPYMQGESTNLNLKSDNIKFERINKRLCVQINK